MVSFVPTILLITGNDVAMMIKPDKKTPTPNKHPNSRDVVCPLFNYMRISLFAIHRNKSWNQEYKIKPIIENSFKIGERVNRSIP